MIFRLITLLLGIVTIGTTTSGQTKIFTETGFDILIPPGDKEILSFNLGVHQTIGKKWGITSQIGIQQNQSFFTYNTKYFRLDEDVYSYSNASGVIYEQGQLNTFLLRFGGTYSIKNLIIEVGAGINSHKFKEVNTSLDISDHTFEAPLYEYLKQIEYSRDLSSSVFFSYHTKVSYLWQFGAISLGPYLDFTFSSHNTELEIGAINGDLSPFTDDPEVQDFNENSNVYNPSSRGLLFGGVHLGYSF